MKNNIEKAINLGKIWMKKSVDSTHNYAHANRVEGHAIKIFEELQPKNVTLDLIRLAVWWHDSYKSRCKFVTIKSILIEGVEAAKIFKNEVGPLLDFKTVHLVSRAIAMHHRGMYIFFNHKKIDNLSMILIEADQLDGLNSARDAREARKIKNWITWIFDLALSAFVPFFILKFHRTKYAEDHLKLFWKKKK